MKLDVAARAPFVHDSVKVLAAVAGLKGRVCAHALRNGLAREVAQFDKVKWAVTGLSEAMNHKIGAVTRTYIGGLTADFIAMRE